jgi:hypothetical protein
MLYELSVTYRLCDRVQVVITSRGDHAESEIGSLVDKLAGGQARNTHVQIILNRVIVARRCK